MNYGKKIKALRERMGTSQKEIANILGISNTTYCDYENENQTIPLKYLIIIVDYFDVSIDYILNLNNNKSYKNIKKDMDLTVSSKRLKEFRKEQKFTQTKLAHILNTTQSMIANYENSKFIISINYLYTISSKYKISADYLLGRIDSPKYLK